VEEQSTALDEVGDVITKSLLSEAVTQGYQVDDDTVKELEPEPEPEPEGPPAQVDAVDKIISAIEEEPQKYHDISSEMDDEEEEKEETPDFEAEAEAELLNQEIADDNVEYVEDEEEEGESRSERKRRIIAEKKAAYYENLTAQRERSKWENEALEHFPFSKPHLSKITATSRRGFLREAKKAHEDVKPFIKEVVSAREAELMAERANIREEEKAKADAAWGKPTAGPGAPSPVGPDYEAEIKAARRKGDLATIIGLRMKQQAEGGEK
jgi:type I site-specific restriction-modification system R (restriction) subunit